MSRIRTIIAGGAAAGTLAAGLVFSPVGAYAAALIGQDDIGAAGVSGHAKTPQSEIQSNSVGQADITAGGVSGSALTNSSEIMPGSIGLPDLSDEVLAGITGPQGDPGPAGPPGADGKDGAPGADGADGADGVAGYEIVGRTADGQDVAAADGLVTVTSVCDSHGEVAIGGGAKTTGGLTLHASYPGGVRELPGSVDEDDPAGRWVADGWTVVVSGDGHVQPYIICAQVSSEPTPAD